MCSSLPGRTAALLLGLAVALAIGCGNKEAPKPPPQRIPQPVRDLVVKQRADQVLISFTYPQTTISGLPIDDIVAIELWQFEMPVLDFAPVSPTGDDEAAADPGEPGDGAEDGDDQADAEGDTSDAGDETDPIEAIEEAVDDAVDDAVEAVADAMGEVDTSGADESPAVDDEVPADADEGDILVDDHGDTEDAAEGASEGGDADRDDDDRDEPTTSKELLLELDPRQFEAAASKRVVLEGNDLSNAISGDKVELELTLDKIEPGERTALIFGVKTFQTLQRASGFSNLARLIPRVTPAPPAEIEPSAQPNGVQLSWKFEGDEPKEFRIYRRDPRSSGFGEHHGTQDGDSDQYLDSRAELGERYVYAMTAVINRTPLVESALSSEHEVEYIDNFPPEPPSDLVVFSDVGSARLLWQESDDDDLVGYVIYRRTAGLEYERLFDQPIRQTEYDDTTAASGRTFFYRVVAVDTAGNMSDPSAEVQVRIP